MLSTGSRAERLSGYRLRTSWISLFTFSENIGLKLPVAFPHHNVVGSKDRDDVGDHVPSGHMVEGSQVDKGGGADLHAVGLGTSIADNIEPKLPLGRLGR